MGFSSTVSFFKKLSVFMKKYKNNSPLQLMEQYELALPKKFRDHECSFEMLCVLCKSRSGL